MTTEAAFRIFVSAVSDELGSYRRKVVDVLHRKGLEVRDQEHFRQGPATLIESLRDYIRQCDAVIVLIGDRCGTFPTDKEVGALGAVPVFDEYRAATNQARAAYTQWEFLLAKQHGKQTYAFFTKNGFVPDAPNPENTDSRALQQAYCKWIKQSGEHYDEFTKRSKLIEDVLVLPFPDHRVEQEHSPIRLRLDREEVKRRFDDQIMRGEILLGELGKSRLRSEDNWYEQERKWDRWREHTQQILNECYNSTEPFEWLQKDVRLEHVSTEIPSSAQVEALRGDIQREIRFLKLMRGRLPPG